jgi:hypothetical protein
MVPVVVAVAATVVALSAWAYLRSRQPKEELYFHFRCPGCKRRLRYREKQVGHRGSCSHCKTNITFPPMREAVD